MTVQAIGWVVAGAPVYIIAGVYDSRAVFVLHLAVCMCGGGGGDLILGPSPSPCTL